MRITPEEADALGRKIGAAMGPVKAPGELLAVWVPGKLVNPLNASAWGWQKRSRLAKSWKQRTGMAVFDAITQQVMWNLKDELLVTTLAGAQVPKRVTFIAHTWNALDGDGLQAAIKPIRDELIPCRVIHSDAPGSGHEFIYAQKIDRARRGVEIRVSLQP